VVNAALFVTAKKFTAERSALSRNPCAAMAARKACACGPGFSEIKAQALVNAGCTVFGSSDLISTLRGKYKLQVVPWLIAETIWMLPPN
jgi:hypothetical protein